MSLDGSVLIAVHGFAPVDSPHYRSATDICTDRLTTAYRLACDFADLGATVTVVISGGGDFDGQSEAEWMSSTGRETIPTLFDEFPVLLETASETTQENVTEIATLAVENNYAFVVPVTSRDHAPRVLRDWLAYTRHENPPFNVLTVGSEDPYTVTGQDPLVVEAAEYAPFVDALAGMWDVSPEVREEAANAVAETLAQFQSSKNKAR